MNNNGLKRKSVKILDIAVIFYIFSLFFADGTLILDIAVVFLYGTGALNFVSRRKFSFNWYCLLNLLFILFNVIMILAGIHEDMATASKRLRSVALNYISNLIIFTYAIDKSNRTRLMKSYIVLASLLIAYILVFNGGSTLRARFGTGTPYLFGMTGNAGKSFNSNGVSYILRTAFMLLLYFNWCDWDHLSKRSKQMRVLALLIFAAFTLLTGSRKGLIGLCLFMIFAYSLRSGSLQKKLKSVLVVSAAAILVYVLIMNVDTLYQIIGHRIEVLVNGILSDEGFEAGTSAFHRMRMQNKGMQMIREKPFLGWGMDAYTTMVSYNTYSHNNFIEILVSSGVVGFILYYSAVLWVLRMCSKGFKTTYSRNESLILFSYLLSMLIMHIGVVEYVDRKSIMLGFVAAAAVIDWKKNKILVHSSNVMQ